MFVRHSIRATSVHLTEHGEIEILAMDINECIGIYYSRKTHIERWAYTTNVYRVFKIAKVVE